MFSITVKEFVGLHTGGVIAATAAFSALSGAAAGFVYATKKLQPMYEQLAQDEIEEAKKFYGALYKKDDYATPEKAADELLSPEAVKELEEAAIALQKYAGLAPDDKLVTEARLVEVSLDNDGMGTVEISKNIFTDARVEEDDDDDEEDVDTDKPYIISSEDFLENEPENEQVTVTYFEGDDVLADSRDQAIDDVEGVIGSENLKFGKKSNDPNVVYIRNEDLGTDIEVLRSKGKYTEEVLGFIEHSDSRSRILRFRGDDE